MNRKAFFSLILALATASCGGGGSDGDNDALSQNACNALTRSARIIDGTPCDARTASVVELNLRGILGSSSLCSGTALTSRAILTAAHCFLVTDATSVSVSAGGRTLRATSWEVQPGAFINNATGLVENDLAIVYVNDDLNVPTAPLALSEDVRPGSVIAIAGYGYDENRQLGQLRSGEMRVSDVTATHIFAEFSRGEGSNTCFGDSGGPAFLEISGGFGVSGVTSTGENDTCLDGDRSAFARTDTSEALNFITSRVPGVGSN